MLPQNITEVNEDYLAGMCQEGRSESQRLDFKRELPGRNDAARSEFLKDLCAFANAGGGDAVYGIDEDDDGRARAISAITGESSDDAERRLGQVAAASMEPRIVGLQFRSVPIAAGGYVLIARVPASFVGPHRYTVSGHSKFVIRAGTHTNELRYDELRNAFDRTATLRERARAFLNERAQRLMGRQTWRNMPAGPIFAMQFIPLQAAAGDKLLDMQALYNNYTGFMFRGWSGGSRSLHLDGLSVFNSRGDGVTTAYTMVFRSGAFEAVRSAAAQNAEGNERIIPGTTIALLIQEAVAAFLAQSVNLGYSGPAAFGTVLTDTDCSAVAHKGFGAEVRAAVEKRTDVLVERGLAQRHGQRAVFARNLLSVLRETELQTAASAIEAESGLAYRATADGKPVSGT